MQDAREDIKVNKTITGAIDSLLSEASRSMDIKLDKDKFEFLRLISKTKYSGLTRQSLIASLKILQHKDDKWFNELIDDGLAETFNFKSPNGKFGSKWEGWFITKKGRKLITNIINNM